MPALVLAEHDKGRLSEATAKTVTAAAQISDTVHVLVAGQNIASVSAAAAEIQGVARVLAADDARYAHQLAEPLAELILSVASKYDAILAPATATGKSTLPRVAARLDVAQVSEIVAVEAPDTFLRPIYAGNAIQKIQIPSGVKVITVRTSAFKAAPLGGNAIIETVAPAADPGTSRFTSENLSVSLRPELTNARIIVSGGRGMGSKENFILLERIADKMGAGLGASRAAVDAGFVPNDYQVGQTGKIVAPELYIAVGISGAIQHLAGMKDSKVIVAINKDPEAPIFQIADYGLVADYKTAIPQLMEELGKSGR
jgi:electron transfer flavoprotein alpha subunit